jgi:hypothetical protein
MPKVLILAEDSAHAALVCALAPLQLEAAALAAGPRADWLVGQLSTLLQWLGTDEVNPQALPGVRYTPHGRAAEAGRSLGGEVIVGGRPVKLRGFIGGASQKPEAAVWRRRLLWGLLEEGADAIIAAQDTDGDLSKLDGLRQVAALLEQLNPKQPVLIAAPHRDAEAWLIAGFRPESHHEADRLAAAQRALSFSPTSRPELLSAHPNDALQDAKRVCRFLLYGAAWSIWTGCEALERLHSLWLSWMRWSRSWRLCSGEDTAEQGDRWADLRWSATVEQ